MADSSHMTCMHHTSCSRGYSSVELLLALVIGTIVILGGNRAMTTLTATNSHVSHLASLLGAKRLIVTTLDCERTLAPYRDANGNIATGTRLLMRNSRGPIGELQTSTDRGSFRYSQQMGELVYAKAIWNGHAVQVSIAKRKKNSWNPAPRLGVPGYQYGFHAPFNPMIGGGVASEQLCPQEAKSPIVEYLDPEYHEVTTVTGITYPNGCHTNFYHPLRIESGCRRWCRWKGFRSGFMSGCRVQDADLDEHGNVIAFHDITDPQYHHVGCSCLN